MSSWRNNVVTYVVWGRGDVTKHRQEATGANAHLGSINGMPCLQVRESVKSKNELDF